MKSNYWAARSYARAMGMYDILDYRDLLHDSYLSWYDKNGSNLFEEPIKRIFNVLKYTAKAKISSKRIQINGDRTYYRSFEQYEDNLSVEPTQERSMIAKEQIDHNIEKINRKFPRTAEQMLEVWRLLHIGYSKKEISIKLGVAKSSITYHINKLKYDL